MAQPHPGLISNRHRFGIKVIKLNILEHSQTCWELHGAFWECLVSLLITWFYFLITVLHFLYIPKLMIPWVILCFHWYMVGSWLDVMEFFWTTYFDLLITVSNCLLWLLLDETMFYIITHDAILATCCGIFIDIIIWFINQCLQLPKIFRNDDHMMENCEILLRDGGILIAHNVIILDNIFWFINHCF